MSKLAGVGLRAAAGAVALAFFAGGASAADYAAPEGLAEVPSMIDVAFGVAGVTDYRWRGISQSDKNPAVQGYAELQIADMFYIGAWGTSVDMSAGRGLTDPALELDVYGGVRHTFSNGVGIDVGGLFYVYPGEKRNSFDGFGSRELDWWEVYAKPSYTFGPLFVSGTVSASADFFNSGANSLYIGVSPKYTVPLSLHPGVGLYVSGEFGKQWIGKTSSFSFDVNPANYLNWNLGVGATYKAATFDVRYVDTDIKKGECALYGSRNWCGAAVIGKISFDTSFSKLK